MKPLKNTRLLGDQGEAAFQCEALARRLLVSKPFGDNAQYDFIVDSGAYNGKPPNLLRVQVRTTSTYVPEGFFVLHTSHGTRRTPITTMQADILAVLIRPRGIWYLIPSPNPKKCVTISLRPDCARSCWTPFREAWHVLGAAPRREVSKKQAVSS